MVCKMIISTCRRRFVPDFVTQDIIFEVLMRMPNSAEKWKSYSTDMKEILFNDFKATYYNLLSLYYIILYYIYLS